MTTVILTLVLLIIAVEAATEIITSSALVAPLQAKLRVWAYPIDQPPTGVWRAFLAFIDQLWNCGYCASVWVAALAGLFAPKLFSYPLVNWVVMSFVLHRLANWLHVVYELLRRGRVNSLDVVLKLTENEDGTIGQSPGKRTTETTPQHS
jgi:hypothetical protein